MSSEPAAARAKTLVLDTNILVRATLGIRVMSVIKNYTGKAHFLTPEIAYQELRERLPSILERRGFPPEAIRRLVEHEAMQRLPEFVPPAPEEIYADLEPEARRRLAGRDEGDWPFLALAIRLDCPIWTEDTDFFGSGVATWTTDRIDVFLREDD